jgi:hypothetical protein
MSMTCYTDWKYIPAGHFRKARDLLRYLQYREDAFNHIPRAGGAERWVDCGLGSSWREVLDHAAELQSRKVLLRSLIIRPPQELVAQLEDVDAERWAARRELLEEVVHRVMDAEMERAGTPTGDDSTQPLDLPYSYVIHAHDDERGIESPHAHVITPAMDRNRERPFNVYPGDHLRTRQVAEEETEALFELDRVRRLTPDLELESAPVPELPDREIEFFSFFGSQGSEGPGEEGHDPRPAVESQ